MAHMLHTLASFASHDFDRRILENISRPISTPNLPEEPLATPSRT